MLFNKITRIYLLDEGFFVPLHGFMDSLKMKKLTVIALFLSLLLVGCGHNKESDGIMLHREFYQTVWERFDFVTNQVEITEPTTYDLGLRISFTDDYPFDYIDLVFAVLTSDGTPYRSKGYKFSVKDKEGNWKSDSVNGVYSFELPINKALQITEAGKYSFKIEQKMPKTPLVGVKELVLFDNNK